MRKIWPEVLAHVVNIIYDQDMQNAFQSYEERRNSILENNKARHLDYLAMSSVALGLFKMLH